MKIQTSELTDLALNWAVAKCECALRNWPDYTVLPAYSTDWALGGPLVEREKINVILARETMWVAEIFLGNNRVVTRCADTPLVAVCRCYVASKLGDVIDIPEELMK